MTKVAIFEEDYSYSSSSLQELINEWLLNVAHDLDHNIIDIKYAMHKGYRSAMIIYEPRKEVKL